MALAEDDEPVFEALALALAEGEASPLKANWTL